MKSQNGKSKEEFKAKIETRLKRTDKRINKFFHGLFAYYGPYKSMALFNAIIEYIENKIRLNALNDLLQYIKYSHPSQYGTPDISAIEKANRIGIKEYGGIDCHKIKISKAEIDKLTAEEKKENDKLFNEKSLVNRMRENARKATEWRN